MRRKYFYIVGLLLALAIASIFIVGNIRDSSLENISDPGKIITSNPLNLEKTMRISTFRSCVGHDYSAFNIDGVEENLRTMKHYIEPSEEYRNTKNQIEVYSPFDGEITHIDADQTPGFPDRGKLIWITPTADKDWIFLFFHTDLLPGIETGTQVSSGQHIGHANMNHNAANFDIAMKGFLPLVGPNIITSPFEYMTDNVAQEYKKAGANIEDLVLTKEYRDQNPCPIEPGTESEHDTFFSQYDSEKDWVELE